MTHGARHVQLDVELNSTLPDLGVGMSNLWQELVAIRPFPAGILDCLNPNCLCLGSLLPVNGPHRHFRHMTESEVREHTVKSDEHKAWQEYLVACGERDGLTASVEVRTNDGRRIQDVHIDGPVPLALEVQLSYIHPTTVAQRVELDRASGDTPLWIANDKHSPVIDRAPWSRVAKETPQRILAGTADLLYGGAMTAVWEECGRRGEIRCPETGRRPCGKKHIHLEPTGGLHLGRLVIGAATGLYRPTQRRDRQSVRHIWLTAADHERYHDDQAARSRSEEKPTAKVEPKPLNYDCGYGAEAEIPAQRAKPRDDGGRLFIPAQRESSARPSEARLDWSRNAVGDPRPCRICRNPAIMRDDKGQPCHRECAELALRERGGA